MQAIVKIRRLQWYSMDNCVGVISALSVGWRIYPVRGVLTHHSAAAELSATGYTSFR
jgi:hypothetical protein